MTFRKVDLIFVVLALLVVGGVALLPSPRDRNPRVPANSTHRAITEESQCTTCHAPQGVRPLPAQHPKRQDCLHCHARSNGQTPDVKVQRETNARTSFAVSPHVSRTA
ncbi:MAG: hypothetical protein QM771_17040 [Nitrospira sp.]